MVFPISEYIVTMVNAKMFFITHIDQAVISSPVIGMDDALGIDSASNYSLKRTFSTIGNNFCNTVLPR